MSIYALPAIAVILAILSLFVPFSKTESAEGDRPSAGAFFVLAALAAAGVLAGLKFGNQLPGLTGGSVGFGLGTLLCALAGGLGFTALRGKADAVPLALGLVAVSASPWMGEGAPLGLVIGAGLAAWLSGFGAKHESPLAVRAAALCTSVVCVNLLSEKWPGPYAGQFGTVLGIAVVGSWIISSLVLKSAARVGGAAALAGVSGYLLCTKLLGASDLWWVLAGGIALAGLAAWFLRDDEPSNAFAGGLACVLFVAAATTAFSFYKGLGMAVLSLTVVATVASLGNRRALAAAGPLMALVLFRVFREEYVDATRSFDIGQHYAIIGLILGAMMPLLALEWRQGPGLKASGRALAGASWVALLLFFPLAAGILLGAKGTIGLLIGAGFAGALGALRGDQNGHTTTLGASFAATLVLGYTWISPYLDLGRNDKLQTLVWLAGVVAGLGILITVLSLNLGKPKSASLS